MYLLCKYTPFQYQHILKSSLSQYYDWEALGKTADNGQGDSYVVEDFAGVAGWQLFYDLCGYSVHNACEVAQGDGG